MSAYVLPRSNFVEIAAFIENAPRARHERKAIYVYHPDVAALKGGDYYLSPIEAANILLQANIESVVYRYDESAREEVKPIHDADIRRAKPARGVDMFGPLRILQYQSCERDDYHASVGYAVLIAVLWLAGETAAKEAGAREWA